MEEGEEGKWEKAFSLNIQSHYDTATLHFWHLTTVGDLYLFMKKKEFRLEKFDYADYKANQLEDGWMYAQGTFYIRWSFKLTVLYLIIVVRIVEIVIEN